MASRRPGGKPSPGATMDGMSEYGRILSDGRATWVRRDGGRLRLLAAAPWDAPSEEGTVDEAGATWLPAVAPSKILALGRTYAEHARERGAEPPREPLLFFKPPSSLLAHGGTVRLPPESGHVDFEGELGLVIGRRVRRFPLDGDPAGVVFGCLTADDVSARDFQKSDGQWARAKGFDTFCPVGPLIREGLPAKDARLRTLVNGEVRQDGTLDQMSFSLAAMIAHASFAMTLEPGDLLLTGTPAGVGRLGPGDRVRVEIEGVPALEHGVDVE
jgi:2-keto-4-pentenoate hydratase/2-oxohepta-3-ene-1,7-dioic acid hydratase in catechol pathway